VLNHTLQGVMAVYNRYDYLAQCRDALCLWSQHLLEMLKTDDIEHGLTSDHRANRELSRPVH
jgi:hypothetical protein